MIIYLIRWTNRPVHKFYREMLTSGVCENSPIKLHIMANGDVPMDELTAAYAKSHPGQVTFEMGTKPLPTFISRAWQKTLNAGEQYFGLLDDDAKFTDAQFMYDRAMEAFSLDAGACGPIIPSMLYFQHLGETEEQTRMAVIRHPWFTSGVQIYDVERLAPLWKPMIKPMMAELKWRSDFQVFMAASDLGCVPREFKCPGYKHATATGSSNGYGEGYWKSRVLTMAHDYEVTAKYVSKFIDPEVYMKSVYRSLAGELRATLRRIREQDTSKWSVPICEDVNDFYAYIERNRELLEAK